MNLTLISLSLLNSSLTSPLFSPSYRSFSLHKGLTYSNLHIANSFQSFLSLKPNQYTTSNQNGEILFSNSKFSHFLHSTISISESAKGTKLLSDPEPRIYKKEKIDSTIYSNEDLVLKTINCFFVECMEPSSGGGINMICAESSLYVYKCCFINCFSQSAGGGISFFGNYFKINDTCFDGCYTMDLGMAMEIYVRGTKEKMVMNGLSIVNCADRLVFENRDDTLFNPNRFDRIEPDRNFLSNVLDLSRGRQILKAVNSTNNFVHLSGGFVFSDESTGFSLSYSVVSDNAADTLFNLYDIRPNTGNISYCSIINNTGQISFTLFDLEDSTLNVAKSTVILNNITTLASNGVLKFENCAYDFDGKNPPLENAQFLDSGSSFIERLKNWRSAKTVPFDKQQIENNEKIHNRCAKRKPKTYIDQFVNNIPDYRYNPYRGNEHYDDIGLDEPIKNRNLNGKDDSENSNEKNGWENEKDDSENFKKIFNNKDEEENKNEDEPKNRNNRRNNRNEDDEDKNEDEPKNRNNRRNNRNEDDEDKNEDETKNRNNRRNIINEDDEDKNEDETKNRNNRRNIINEDDEKDKENDNSDDRRKNRNNDDDDEDEKNSNKRNRNQFGQLGNKLKIDDNEEEDEEDDNNNRKKHNNQQQPENIRSRAGLLTFVFVVLICGAAAFAYFYFVKNKERDINQLEDVELL